MNKAINAIRRSLNLSQKEIQAYQEKGYRPVTFVGENLRPFYAFAKTEELADGRPILKFQHLGEFIHAKYFGEELEGWFKKTKILIFEVLDLSMDSREEFKPELLTA